MKLIVNADDLGFSEKVNEDIMYCHQNGIVTSSTLLAGAEAFEHAIDLAKQNSKLDIGVHLAIDGPLNIGQEYKSLLDPYTGNFYKDSEIVKMILKRGLDHKELVKEYSLQIEKVQRAGIKITHLDHHHHLHLYFPILKAVIAVAKKYDIPYIRTQRLMFSSSNNAIKKTYRLLHHYYLKRNHNSVDGYVCIYESKREEMMRKLQLSVNSNEKTFELVVHPSYENGEVDFLTDIEVKSLVQGRLISFSSLAEATQDNKKLKYVLEK